MLPQKSEFCIVCLGRDTLNLPVGAATQALDTVYNIVVRAPDIVAYRQKVQVSAGPAQQQSEFQEGPSCVVSQIKVPNSGCTLNRLLHCDEHSASNFQLRDA